MNTSPFSVFNASAGSGKTFTLVKEVLKVLLKTPASNQYHHLLAITFTNKAVAEMKERVLTNLYSFSQSNSLTEPNDMMSSLSKECNLSLKVIQQRSKRVLASVLHNFSALEISTIDGFTHRVIRTFARDLGLSSSFEVVLDAEELLKEAVDSLFSEIDSNPVLMRQMTAFALEKMRDNKSWDISRDFFETAKLVLDENHYHYLLSLKKKSQSDFLELQKTVHQRYNQHEQEIFLEVKKTQKKINELGLEASSFAYKDFPNFLQKCIDKKWDKLHTERLSKQIESGTLYTKKTDQRTKEIIDNHGSFFLGSYNRLLSLCAQALMHQTFSKSLPTFSLINAIRSRSEAIQKEQNTMLISAFNKLISQTINEQPAPFIYERLGIKFQHYFIDEFQDTSQLQWQNLIPLIAHSLEGLSHTGVGSLLLVGDAKQSIYRWRGGRAEQFISLSKKNSPFSTKINSLDLTKNFRSFSEVVRFNNSFFQFISTLFSDENHQQLYANGSQQEVNSKNGGYVSLDFIEAENAEEEKQKYTQKVLEIIQFSCKQGFSYGNQCVLTRTKNQGVIISEFLVKNGIPVISSETLLLKNSKEVQLLLALLRLQVFPEEMQSRNVILSYCWENCSLSEDYYLWLKKHIQLPLHQFFEALQPFDVQLEFELFVSSTVYESMEIAIQSFGFTSESNAYIHYFMDAVFEFSQKQSTSVSAFLEHWEKQKDKLTIASGDESQNAVRIMTIHKSKGLEFDVVIFPFAKTKINDSQNPKSWFPVDPKQYDGFSNILIPIETKTNHIGEQGRAILNEYLSQQELDTFNLLYVTLTRAKEQLYIVSQQKRSKAKSEPLSFSKVLRMYLENQGLWNKDKFHYSWGNALRNSSKEKQKSPPLSLQWTANKSVLQKILVKKTHYWDGFQNSAKDFGLLFHEIMAKVRFSYEIPQIMDLYRSTGSHDPIKLDRIEKNIYRVVTHPKLVDFYTEQNNVMNERSIYTEEGEWIIPDRIVTNSKGQTTVLDYKTGAKNVKHQHQINTYAKALSKMGFSVINQWIIYLGEKIEILECHSKNYREL